MSRHLKSPRLWQFVLAALGNESGLGCESPKDLDVAKGEDENGEPPSPRLPFLIHLPKEPLLRSFSRQLQALDARDSPPSLGHSNTLCLCDLCIYMLKNELKGSKCYIKFKSGHYRIGDVIKKKKSQVLLKITHEE